MLEPLMFLEKLKLSRPIAETSKLLNSNRDLVDMDQFLQLRVWLAAILNKVLH